MKLETDKVLTPAETRVASGYVSGMIGKEIASAAGISHNTVILRSSGAASGPPSSWRLSPARS